MGAANTKFVGDNVVVLYMLAHQQTNSAEFHLFLNDDLGSKSLRDETFQMIRRQRQHPMG